MSSLLLDVNKRVKDAQLNKLNQGYKTQRQQYEENLAQVEQQAAQINSRQFDNPIPEGELKSGLGALISGIPGGAIRSGLDFIGEVGYKNNPLMNGNKASWSQEQIEAAEAYKSSLVGKANVGKSLKNLEAQLAQGKIDQATYQEEAQRLSALNRLNDISPEQDAILKSPVVKRANGILGNVKIEDSVYDALKKYDLSNASRDDIAGNDQQGTDDFFQSKKKFGNNVGNYYADLDNQALKDKNGDDSALGAISRWAKVAKDNPSIVGSAIGESLQYIAPTGFVSIVGDTGNLITSMEDRVKDKTGRTTFATKEDQDRINLAGLAYGASSVASAGILGGALTKSGVGSIATNSVIGKTLSKVAGSGAKGAALKGAAAIGIDAIAEGSQEVLQSAIEAYGADEELTADTIGQSFVLGAAAGGGFSTAGQAIGGTIKGATNKLKNSDTYKDANATDEQSLDINSDLYNPSRVLKERSKSINNNLSEEQLNTVNTEVDTILRNTEEQLATLKQNQAINSGTDLVARSNELNTRLDELDASLDSGTLSEAETTLAIEESQQIINTLSNLKTEEEYKTAIDKVEKNLKQLETEHGNITAKLSDIRASKGYGDAPIISNNTTESNSNSAFISDLKITPDSVDTSSDTYAPAKNIKALTARSNELITDTESEVLRSKAKSILDDSNKARKEFDNITEQIKEVQSNVRNTEGYIEENQAKLNNPEFTGDKSVVQTNLDNAQSRLKYYKEERDSLYKEKSKYNPKIVSLNNEANKAMDTLNRKIDRVNNSRTNEINKLQKVIKKDKDNISKAKNKNSPLFAKTQERLSNNESRLNELTNRETDGANKKKAREAKAKAEIEKKQATEKLSQISKLEKEKEELVRLKKIEERDLKERKNKEERKVPTKNIKDLDKLISDIDNQLSKLGDKESLEARGTKPVETKTQSNTNETTQTKPQEVSTGIVRRLTSILKSNSTGLTEAQITKLEDIARRLKESVILENRFKKSDRVSKEIYEGSDNFKGLRAYDGSIELAIKNNDQARLNKELASLELFMLSHESKAKAITEAYKLYRDSNESPSKRQMYVVLRDKDSATDWTYRKANALEKTGLTKAIKDTGSILVGGTSFKLRDSIVEESKAITMRYKALKDLAAMDISTFDKSVTTNTDNSNKNNIPLDKFKEGTLSSEINEPVDASVNYYIADDGKRRLLPELVALNKERTSKGLKSLENMYQAYQVLTKDANKFIGFGLLNTNSQESRLRSAFEGRANTLTNYNESYKASDVVVYHKDNGYVDSPAMAQARRAELDAAIKAGATIKVIPSRFDRSKTLTDLSNDIEYLKSQGYTEGKAYKSTNGTDGVFTKTNAVSKPTQTVSNPAPKQVNNTSEVITPKIETKAPVTNPTANQDTNPNDKYDILVSPNQYFSEKENLYNATIEEDWKPNAMLPVQKDVPVQEGKLNVEGTLLTQRDTPLNNQVEFFNKIIASKDYDTMADMLGITELTQAQKIQVNSFIRLHNKISKRVNNAIKQNSTEFADLVNNPLYKYLLKDGTNVNDNLVTALTVGLYQYIQSNGRKAYPTSEEVNIIHGINKNSKLSYGTANDLAKAGIHRGFLFQEIGSGAISALGLTVGDEANTQLIEQLESSIGALAYTAVTQVKNNKTDNPFFIEYESNGIKGMSHREQALKIINGLSNYDAKNYVKDLGIIEPELIDNISSQDSLTNLVETHNSPYWDSRVNLVRPAMSRFWDKKSQTGTTYFNPEILDIIKSSEKPNGEIDVIDNLFKMDKQKIAPLNEPMKSLAQKKVKKSNTDIPDNTVKALEKSSKNTWAIETSRADAVLKLYDSNPEALYKIMGITPDSELLKLHPVLREMRMGDNAIKKELMNEQIAWLKSKKEDNNYSPYYQVPIVWVNQRVGYESTLFNAQTNLFARMLSSMDKWKTTVDTTEDLIDSEGNPTKHGMLLVAIAESMEGASKKMDFSGTKYSPAARTVDKVLPRDFLPKFVDYLETDTVQEAIKSTDKLLNNKTLDNQDYSNIEQAVNEFGMDELGFGALVELTKYMKAKGGNYETSIGAKSDGVTNGPIFTQFLLGTATSAIRMMGGIIGKDNMNNVTNYLESKAKGQIDLYERTGESMRSMLTNYIPSDTSLSTLANVKDALALIDGDFGNRSWAKKLLTPFNYGAGLPRLRAAIASSVVDKFNDNFYATYSIENDAERKQAQDNINNTLNKLIAEHNELFVHKPINNNNFDYEVNKLVYIINQKGLIKDLNPLDSSQANFNIIKAYYTEHKPKSAFHKKKSDLEKVNWLSQQVLRRADSYKNIDNVSLNFEEDIPNQYQEVIRNLADISFGVASKMAIEVSEAEYMFKRDELTVLSNNAYNNYDQLRNIYIESLGLDSNNMTVAQQKAVDKELFNYRAAVASGMSNLNVVNDKRKKAIATGINLEDQVKQTRLGLSVAFNKLFRGNNDKSPTVSYDYGYTYDSKGNPGVRALALMIQSMDSAVSLQAMAEYEGMNFHDANMFGLDDFTKGVKYQNERFFNAVINYDPSREFVKAYIRPYYKLDAMYNDESNSSDIRNHIYKVFLNEADKTDIHEMFERSYDNEITKLELALEDGIIHQYSGAGGEYRITDTERTLIEKRLEEVKKAKITEINSFNKLLAKYTGKEFTPNSTDSFFDYLSENNQETSRVIKDMIATGNTNINQLTGFITSVMEASNSSINDKSVLGYLNRLKDTDLSKVKIKYTNAPLKSKKYEESSTSDVRYSKLTNTLFINKNNPEVKTTDILKEMLVASLHNNLKAIKNGSEQFKELTEDYRTLKVMSDNIVDFANRALKDNTSNITSEQVKLIADVFNKPDNAGNVEFLMTVALYGDKEIKEALSNIPDYKVANNQTVMQRIVSFMKKVLSKDSSAQDNLLDFLTDTTNNLLEGGKGYDGLVQKRSSSSISKMISDSYKSHPSAFSLESTDQRANTYDTRFQHELYKLSIKNGNKPMKARDVISVIEGTLNSLEEQDKSKSEVSGLQADYETTLKPVVELLKTSLAGNTEVVIINDISDLTNNGLTDKEISDANLLEDISKGRAFTKDNTVFLISPNASSNPNTRMSIVVHELLHAMTSAELDKKNKHYKNLNTLIKTLTDKAKEQGVYSGEIEYALSNPHELVSQIKTRKEVRDFLGRNEVERKDFFKFVTNALGSSNTDTANALEIFDVIFGSLDKEIQKTVIPMDMIDYKPVAFTDRTMKMKLELDSVGIVDNKGQMVRDLLDFNNQALESVINRQATKIDKSGLDSESEVVQALEEHQIADASAKIHKSNQQAGGHVNAEERFNPRTIYDFLKGNQDNSYLDNVMDDIVDPLMENINDELVRGYDYEKVWHDAIVKGEDVYASKAHQAGFVLDDQQNYALEVLEVALANSIDDVVNTAVYRQLEKAYKQAKANVKMEDFHDGDWVNATPDEVLLAQSKFNFIFRPGNTGGKSDYLTNFAAMTLVSKELQEVLSFSVDKRSTDKPMNERITNLFGDIVEFFEGQSATVYNSDNVSTKVQDLSYQLAKVYYKNQDIAKNNERGMFNKVDDTVSDLSQKALDYIKAGAISLTHVPGVKNSKVGKISNKLLTNQYDDFDKFVNYAADYSRANKPLGELGEVFNELAGTLDNPEHQQAKDLFIMSKVIEQERGGIIEDTAKALKEAYAPDNRELSKEQEKANTNVLLRSDLQHLMKSMNFQEVMNLVKDSKELDTKIKSLEDDISKVKYGNEYLARGKSLANYMIHRKATNNMLAKNAYAIVERVGMGGVEREISYTPDTLNKLDTLVSMYALRLTNNKEKQLVADLYEKELSLNDKKITGLEYSVLSHKDFAEESIGLFDENPYSIAKGYLPNLLNPIKGFVVVDASEVSQYKQLGYVEASSLNSSELEDISTNKVLMTTSNTGKQRYVSGAVSIEDTIKSGTTLIRKGDKELGRMVAQARTEMKRATKTSDSSPDFNSSYLIPSYDKDGDIISYGYEMNAIGLDSHLERNNDSSTLLSQLKGANLNKKAYPSHNKKIADYLMDSFNNADVKDKRKFVEVGPNVTSKRGRELWYIMPKETQLYIIDKQGTASINVRNDEMNLLYGYRKYNLGGIFDKQGFERNLAEKVYAAIYTGLFGDKAQLRSNQVISFWMEAIKTLKDFIVVRNFRILMGNVLSNVSLTMVNEADPKNMIKDIKDAATYSIKYQKDKQRLNTVRHELKIGLSTPSLVSEYAELKDAISRNPLKDFIESGMMPLIVNDISFKRGEVDFSTGMSTLKDKTVGKLPKSLQTGIDYLLVAPGTPHYKFLANATQQSDFVFKYAIYKQEMRRGANSKDAINLARKVFIEYDVPTSKGMQFINDNGIWMFTKFTMRIMRVLVHFFKTRANKLLIENAAMGLIFNNPSLISLNFLSQLWGGRNPLNFPIDDVLTMYNHAFPVQMIKAAVK